MENTRIPEQYMTGAGRLLRYATRSFEGAGRYRAGY